MREKFRKIMSVVGSALLVGSTIGFAMAAGGGFPAPFVESNTPDYAIVVGTGAAASDMTGANSINTYLNTFFTIGSEDSSDTLDTSSSTSAYTGDFSDAVGITEDEIELGESITGILKTSYTDSKIPTLLDTEISWDDGFDSKKYDVHEEINIVDGGLVFKTTLDDDELEEDVVLENSKALQYKFVFDDVLNISQVGEEDANALFLTILGKEYEILDMDDNSITVSFSDEKVVKTGDKVVSDGVTLTIGDIFSGSVEVNGILVKEGYTRTINGIEVYIDTIAYHSYSDLPSKAIIKVGRDISQKISDEDEYLDDEETWVWDINDLGTVGGYIGVTYDINSVSYDEDEKEENAITVGQSYALPENYGAIVFEGLTDVTYKDFEISFDDRDLYDGEAESEKLYDDEDVAILEGENDDSITLNVDGMQVETDSLYFRYVPEVIGNSTNSTVVIPADVEIYFKDIDGDIDDDHEGRIQLAVNPMDIKMVVGDTEMDIDRDVTNTSAKLTIGDEVIEIALGVSEGSFDGLGLTKLNAESADVIVNGTKIGSREDDVFTHYGVYVIDPENNADSDKVRLSVPSEQVFAKISVKGQGMDVEISDVDVEGNETEEQEVQEVVIPELGGVVIKDSEVASHVDKNLVLIGGSCINSATAAYLGGKKCGTEFTLATGITINQALIQKFVSLQNAEKVAIVVAGYEAADTTRAVDSFIASDTDYLIGTKVLV